MLRMTLSDKMGQNMTLKMVHFDQRNISCQRESLGKRGANKQGAQQSRTSGESNRTNLIQGDTGLFNSLINDRNNILLVRTRCQLWYHATIRPVNILSSNFIAQHQLVSDYSRGCVITGGFYSQNNDVSVLAHIFCPCQFPLFIYNIPLNILRKWLLLL